MDALDFLKVVLAADSPESIAQAALEQMQSKIAFDLAIVVAFDYPLSDSNVQGSALLAMLNCESSRPDPLERELAQLVRLEPYKNLQGGEIRSFNDLSAASHLNLLEKALLEAGERATISVPLEASGEIIGALCLSKKVEGPFTPEELAAAHQFADLLAIAIQKARLFKQMQDRSANLEPRINQLAMQLEAANRELEEFAYSVSHDLRAPLRGLDGYSRALLEDYGPQLDKLGKAYLNYISEASRRMASQVDHLLKLSRIMHREISITQVDLSAMAAGIAEQLHATQPERQVMFTITPGLLANADENLVNIMLTNLLNNAWKFTSRQPSAHIEFGMIEREGKPVYFVRDDGAGYNMAYQDRLFLPFQQLHSAQEFEGSGVGLATVKRIIKRHHGSVWAEGEEGKGATFYFTLQGDTL